MGFYDVGGGWFSPRLRFALYRRSLLLTGGSVLGRRRALFLVGWGAMRCYAALHNSLVFPMWVTMDILRRRDHLERMLLAWGTRVAPEDVPPDLVWRTWRPRTQGIYVWHLAVHGGHLWGWLVDAEAAGGVWRLPISASIRRALRGIARHLGSGGAALIVARLCSTAATATAAAAVAG